MTSLEQKIEIMQAFANGAKIEYLGTGGWVPVEKPFWDWSRNEYRIAKPEPKKVKLLAWFDTMTLRLSWLGEGSAVSGDWQRVPAEDKEITLP